MIRFVFSVAWLTGALLIGCAGSQKQSSAVPSTTELSGTYSYMADAAVFTDCATGRRYPVAFEGDNIALQRAYAEVRPDPGQPVFVVLDGRIEERPPMEGDGTVPTLVVDRFGRFYPGETCGQPGATAELQDTYWRLVRLGGEPVLRLAETREPHLVFHSEERRLAGSTGCNRLNGEYGLDGRALDLGRLATTKMACPDQGQETRFLAALTATATWRIVGVHLELLDEAAEVLARFEATPLT